MRDQLLAAYPGLAKCADLHFVEAEIRPSATEAGNIEAWIESRIPATAIYVCCGDDHANLSLAIGLRRLYALKDTATPPLFVHQRSSYELVDGLAELHGNSFDALRIIPFGGLAEEADPYYVVDEEVDVLSRLLHERYLLERQQSGANNPTPAAVPWPDLADSYRSANRSQADHIVVKLRNLGWHAVITSGSTPHGDLPPVSGALLEQMANQEHERWCRDRWLAGWTYDAKRNDAELQHPNLLPYEDLPDDIRQYDRIAITQLPNLMEGLGVSIRQGQRLGLWFESCDSAPSAELIEKVLDRLQADRSRDTRARYLQLILPLRNPAETKLAASLSNYVDCGVEVALIRPFSKSSVSIGPKVDRDDARLIIAAADRASTLLPPYSPEVASEVTHLSAFCGVCDKVLLICEDAETCESIIHQMDAQLHDKVEFVAIRY